jgi:hypothetical protein
MLSFAFREVEALTFVTSAGGAGDATTAEVLRGGLWALDVDYGTADGTTVLTASIIGGAADGNDRTIFVTAASNTDGLRFPRFATTKAADGTAGTGEEVIPIAGRKIKIAAASAGSTKTITVRLFILQ